MCVCVRSCCCLLCVWLSVYVRRSAVLFWLTTSFSLSDVVLHLFVSSYGHAVWIRTTTLLSYIVVVHCESERMRVCCVLCASTHTIYTQDIVICIPNTFFIFYFSFSHFFSFGRWWWYAITFGRLALVWTTVGLGWFFVSSYFIARVICLCDRRIRVMMVQCVPILGLGFRRGSYKCVCRKGFYFPETNLQLKYFNGSTLEEEYEKFMLVSLSHSDIHLII